VSAAALPEDLLSGYLDDELDAETRAAVEAQLATSPAWRAVLADVQAARDAVRALPRVDLAPASWERLLTAVRDDPDEEPSIAAAAPRRVAARRPSRSRPARWAGAAAMAAAAALIAAMVVPGQHQVTPKVATFSTAQNARASVSGDPVSALAGVGLMRGSGSGSRR
jgi:anti-sigma factor RsiW